MQQQSKLRLWQLSLRTLLLTTTVICVGTGVYARWIHPRKLELLVEKFNETIDERRYDDAYEIALEAKRGYPKHPDAELLVEKAKFAKQISYSEAPIERGFVGYPQVILDPTPEPPDAETEVTYMDKEWWEALAAKWKQR